MARHKYNLYLKYYVTSHFTSIFSDEDEEDENALNDSKNKQSDAKPLLLEIPKCDGRSRRRRLAAYRRRRSSNTSSCFRCCSSGNSLCRRRDDASRRRTGCVLRQRRRRRGPVLVPEASLTPVQHARLGVLGHKCTRLAYVTPKLPASRGRFSAGHRSEGTS